MKTAVDPRWVRHHRITPSPQMRLVCFAHAGGSASYFRHWVGQLPRNVDLLAVQYPGREDRFNETCMTSVSRMAMQAGLALQAYGDVPLILFGHSMGAVIAYETALWLEKAGQGALHLFVSGHPAPHLQRASQLHLADDASLLADVLRQNGAAQHALQSPELSKLFLPILRSDYQALETYHRASTEALACNVDVVAGTHDSEISGLEAQGWQQASHRVANITRFAGGHFYLNDQYPALIQHVLRRAQYNAFHGERTGSNETA